MRNAVAIHSFVQTSPEIAGTYSTYAVCAWIGSLTHEASTRLEVGAKAKPTLAFEYGGLRRWDSGAGEFNLKSSTSESDTGAANFRPPDRIEVYLTAKGERRVLNRLCRALPASIMPDHLSAIGLFGAALSGLSYVAANMSPRFFWLSSLGLLINWFGDSLDGSLARYRKIERPRYGYFVDHSLDVINYCCLFIGLGFSPYVPMNVALIALVGILLMHVYTLMSNHLSETFNATVLNLGPTELRLVFVYLNTSMYIRGSLQWGFLGVPFSPYVVGVAAMGAIFIGIFLVDVFVLARKLAREHDRTS